MTVPKYKEKSKKGEKITKEEFINRLKQKMIDGESCPQESWTRAITWVMRESKSNEIASYDKVEAAYVQLCESLYDIVTNQ